MTSRVLASTGAYTTASASIAQISSSVPTAFTPIGSMPADLTDVAPDLVGAVHPRADELELADARARRRIASWPTKPVAHWITR